MATKKTKVVHHIIRIIGGAYRTACGVYLDNPTDDNHTVYHEKVTCKNCLRSHQT